MQAATDGRWRGWGEEEGEAGGTKPWIRQGTQDARRVREKEKATPKQLHSSEYRGEG